MIFHHSNFWGAVQTKRDVSLITSTVTSYLEVAVSIYWIKNQ